VFATQNNRTKYFGEKPHTFFEWTADNSYAIYTNIAGILYGDDINKGMIRMINAV
jgi:hypothetical protein